MSLLRRRQSGPFFRSFASNRAGYSPQAIAKLSSPFHSPRYTQMTRTGSQRHRASAARRVCLLPPLPFVRQCFPFPSASASLDRAARNPRSGETACAESITRHLATTTGTRKDGVDGPCTAFCQPRGIKPASPRMRPSSWSPACRPGSPSAPVRRSRHDAREPWYPYHRA